MDKDKRLDGLADFLGNVGAKAAQGLLQLPAGEGFAGFQHVHDGGLDGQGLEPLAKAFHLQADDVLGPGRFLATLGQIFLHDLLQVVDVVEVDVVQTVDVRVDVAGHGDIDKKHGLVPSGLEHGAHVPGFYDHMGGAGGADDDVHLVQAREEFLEGHGPPLEASGQFLGPGVGAVGHQNLRHAGIEQMDGGQLGHLAGPDQHGLLAGHLAENALGQFHGRVADGHGAGPDAGGRPHFLGHGKGLVAQPVGDDPGGAAGHGVAVGGL